MSDNMAVHYSSKTDKWETPQDFFDMLDAEFHFGLDVCAGHGNAKCREFYDENADGLSRDWQGYTCWMNPPYGDVIGAWMRKAYESAQSGALVVCLVPSRTDTAWWHDYAMKASEIRLVIGRLKFGGFPRGAPFPSAVVVFRPGQGGMGLPVLSAIPRSLKEKTDDL